MGKKKKEKCARHQFSGQKASTKPSNYFIRRREKQLEAIRSKQRIRNIEWDNRVTGGKIFLSMFYLHFEVLLLYPDYHR